METHLNPKVAKSDAANAIKFSEVETLWKQLIAINAIVKAK
jgi:3-deoxy-D-manno-octulosonic acid (KDO) 8-phosphate synthase